MSKPVAEIMAEIESWKSPADELEKLGVTGFKEDCRACPMAAFIVSQTDSAEVAGIYVENEKTIVTAPDGSKTEFENPLRMRLFIQDFDEGEYPSLDADPDPDEWDDEFDEEFDDLGSWD